MRTIIFISILTVMAAFCFAEEKTIAPADTNAVEHTDSVTVGRTNLSPTVIAYYFHGNRRCVSCKKIESYSQDAVETGFADELKSGALQWQVVNIDEDEYKHYIKDYQLYTKSVVLSKIQDGKEVAWKNLDKVWTLLGDKEDFMKYVRDELHAFLNETQDK